MVHRSYTQQEAEAGESFLRKAQLGLRGGDRLTNDQKPFEDRTLVRPSILLYSNHSFQLSSPTLKRQNVKTQNFTKIDTLE